MTHKKFGEMTINNYRSDAYWHVDYGPTRGSHRFQSLDEMIRELSDWSDREIGELSKQLAALTKLKRWLAKI